VSLSYIFLKSEKSNIKDCSPTYDYGALIENNMLTLKGVEKSLKMLSKIFFRH